MKIEVENLYLHADGGFYCLMSPDAPMKHPDTGDWIPGVIYTGVDGQLRSTSRARWEERFEQMVSLDILDEEVLAMVRRCNPGDRDLDFVRVFESWHESEVNLTSEMLTLAVAATLVQNYEAYHNKSPESIELTIMTEDLHEVSQNYELSKDPIPHGFIFKVRKSFPE